MCSETNENEAKFNSLGMTVKNWNCIPEIKLYSKSSCCLYCHNLSPFSIQYKTPKKPKTITLPAYFHKCMMFGNKVWNFASNIRRTKLLNNREIRGFCFSPNIIWIIRGEIDWRTCSILGGSYSEDSKKLTNYLHLVQDCFTSLIFHCDILKQRANLYFTCCLNTLKTVHLQISE